MILRFFLCSKVKPNFAMCFGGNELSRLLAVFCLQDAIKKTSRDELPDFYNIVLERPRDDAAGFDVLFIDAAAKV